MNDQQSYLSKFFKPLPSPSSQPQRTPIVIDGSESEDEVQPIASTSKRPRSPNSPGRVSVNKKHKVTGNLASWYFDAQDTEPKSPKPSETQKRLRGKFLGNLSQKTSGYLDKDSRYTPQSRQRKTSSELNEVQKLRRAKVTYTPLEEQWLNFKEANPDMLLILQSGYKFQFFGEDAIIASQLLNVAAIRAKHLMSAMIPEQRVPIHIKRLLQAGHKVGIVRQVETAALKKAGANKSKLFERKLTDVYTLATWVDDLDVEDQPGGTGSAGLAGSICCLFEGARTNKGTDERVKISLVCFRPATGDLVYDSFEDGFIRSNLEGRLLHLRPTELLCDKDLSGETKNACKFTLNPLLPFPIRIDNFKPKSPEISFTELQELFGERTDTYVLDNLEQSTIIAFAALGRHLREFGLESLFRRAHIRRFNDAASMSLQANTLKNLEIFNNSFDHREFALYWLLNRCKTSFGRRRLRHWLSRPLISLDRIHERQNCIEEIIESRDYKLDKLKGLLGNLPDLEKGIARVHCHRIKPPELLRLLMAFDRVSRDFSSAEAKAFQSQTLKSAIATLPDIRDKISTFLSFIDKRSASESNKADMFGDKYESILDAKDHVAVIEAELQQELKDIRKVLNKPQVGFHHIAGEEYLVEVRISESKKLVPSDWLRINQTKSHNRYRSPKVTELLTELEQARERLSLTAEDCYKLFLQLSCKKVVPDTLSYFEISRDVSAEGDKLGDVVRRLAEVDCLFALASVSIKGGYVKPTFVDTPGFIDIRDARHPIVEEVSNDPHVPNDLLFPGVGEGPQSLILTGLNMGGKSTLSRTIGLSVILAQLGCWVPASGCRMSVFDGVYTRMGAADDLSAGRSTFMVELAETSEILKAATPSSLCIIDELGRGTSTTDGLSVALAVLQRLADLGCVLIFITHYAQLQLNKELEKKARSAHMAFVEEEEGTTANALPMVHFLYKLKIGASGKSHGLNVARLAGLPQSVIARARTKAAGLEEEISGRLLRNRSRRLLCALQSTGSDDNGQIAVNEAPAVLEMLK